MRVQRSKPGTGLCILLSVAIVVLFFVASIAVSFVFAVLLAGDSGAKTVIGVNYGRVADNLPPPARVVQLIKQLKIGRVKIYDADASVLRAMAGSNLLVTIMVTNQEVADLAASPNASDAWVQRNVVAWLPRVRIETVVVGNEILSDKSLRDSTWLKLVPAMENIHASLQRARLSSKVSVTTSLAIDCLEASYPPSAGAFRSDVAETVVRPLLRFIIRTRSFFFINVYPYFAALSDPGRVPLAYALLDPAAPPVADGGISYRNMLDAQLDALVMAMTRLGLGSARLAISETGWPSQGDAAGMANVANAAAYNRRLVRRVVGATAHVGTPRRPGHALPTFLFSLFNENQKPGAATEKNWGLLYPNGSRVYDVDLTGKRKETEYPGVASKVPSPGSAAPPQSSAATAAEASLLKPTALDPQQLQQQQLPQQQQQQLPQQQQQLAKQWCVAQAAALQEVSVSKLQAAIDYACQHGDCLAIQQGGGCYRPVAAASHASYAFNSYWQKMKAYGGSCSFQGLATLTTADPSYGSCVYPAV